jgi:hypothetical protein
LCGTFEPFARPQPSSGNTQFKRIGRVETRFPGDGALLPPVNPFRKFPLGWQFHSLFVTDHEFAAMIGSACPLHLLSGHLFLASTRSQPAAKFHPQNFI